ncbi:hypothetical protein MHYP_G00003120 [Metynnis hypsauchen]
MGCSDWPPHSQKCRVSGGGASARETVHWTSTGLLHKDKKSDHTSYPNCGLQDPALCAIRAVSTVTSAPQNKMLLLAVLQLVQWMATALAGNGPPPDCCNKLSDKNYPVTHMEKYVHQNSALCPVKAVRFTTINSKIICADPEKIWTKRAMCFVDKSKSTSRAEAIVICRGLTMVTTPSKPSTTVLPKTSTTAPSNPSTTATPVSVPSKKTVGRIETEIMVKSPVEDNSPKKSSPNFNRESAETSSVEQGDENESRKSSDENESPAGISKTKNTELEESLYSEERETLSSVMNEQSPNKNTMFCLKQVPAKSSSSYFCIKGSL